jgi:hypothetical protein
VTEEPIVQRYPVQHEGAFVNAFDDATFTVIDLGPSESVTRRR